MTEDELEQMARDSRNAQRLIEDELFRKALATVTTDAMQRLIHADAGNTVEILRAQETVKVCNSLLGQLASAMDLHAINARPKMA